MIRRLKKRMILLVLAGLLLASAGLVFAINLMNWQSLNEQAGQVLSMLAENNGRRPVSQRKEFKEAEPPRENMEEGGKAPEGTPPAGTVPPDNGRGRMENDRLFQKNSMAALTNAANLANYFSAVLNGEGNVLSWQSDRTDLYTDEQIEETARAALKDGRLFGRMGDQFFKLTEGEKERLLIVVDFSLEIQNAQDVLRMTALVAVIEDALLSVAAVWLIRRLVRPVDEAMEKQKQFVWDASHELKTPLAVISANAEALEAEAGPSTPLSYIRSEVSRTDQLIQNLLTLARMEKGTAQAAPVKFDLSRALLEVALPFESAVFEAGKTMTLSIPEDISCTGDPDMIKQLAVILLSNAEKYSDDGGEIRVSLEAKGDKRLIRVFNTGPAIPHEAQEKIFDRFFRVDSSHNRKIEGNGLGLAIARSIVDAHRGKIAVRSEEGEGTAFTVTLSA